MPTPKSKSQEFTASGTFTVPAGVSSVWVTMIGGGGGGAGTFGAFGNPGGGGGGAGEYCREQPYLVTPAGVIAVVIGAAGTAGPGGGSGRGGTGGASTFGVLRVQGGWGGVYQNVGEANCGCFGGAGGNGGGVGGQLQRGTCDFTGGNPEVAGRCGIPETRYFYAGSGGGGSSQGGTVVGANGGPCEGFDGGIGGVSATPIRGGGGGGAASPWGAGGNAGDQAHDGFAPLAGAYGAGGGGSGGTQGSAIGFYAGGAGLSGYCLVEWADAN